MERELFTITEFCKMAGIGRTLAYDLIKSGDLRAVKVGRKTMIPRAAIESWLGSLPTL